MPLSRKILYSFFLSFFLTFSFGIIKDFRGKSEDIRGTKIPASELPVKVSARVGGYVIDLLTGWTSPFAEITLTSQGLARKTTADEKGFFAFYFIPVPENLGELCLISQDVSLLPSFPTCLAPPPKNRNIAIRDVLLSPTISLESDKIPSGKTTKASGMTFPNSEVEVYFFTEAQWSLWSKITKIFPKIKFPKLLLVQNSKPSTRAQAEGLKVKSYNFKFKLIRTLINSKLLTANCPATAGSRIGGDNFELCTLNFKLIRSAEAFGLPKYQVKSNENGYFEFSLPATSPSSNRVFAAATFGNLDDSRSPKSNTLAFQSFGLLGLLRLFLQIFFSEAQKFFGSLHSKPVLLILIELLILLALAVFIIAKKYFARNEEGL